MPPRSDDELDIHEHLLTAGAAVAAAAPGADPLPGGDAESVHPAVARRDDHLTALAPHPRDASHAERRWRAKGGQLPLFAD
eukprot:861083-Prymnesium_polylepis.1